MKSNRLLCILLSVFCTLLLFAGCGSSDSQGWNVQNDSLLNFPWGCTVEDAQSFLGLSDADLVDKGDFSAPEQAGNDHRYVTYQLPEGHAYPFDYLMLTDEQYTDSSGKIYPVGITTITMGYTEYRIENGERIELEIPQKKLDHLEKTFHQQVKRCKDSYTANILGYDGKTYPTPACGEWTEAKWESLGCYRNNLTLPGYEKNTYEYEDWQNRYPLVMAQHSKTRIDFTGLLEALTKENLPDTLE